MALWQITKEGAPTGVLFDDRQVARPGDEEFTVELAAAEAQRLKAGGFNYVGPSPDLVDTETPE